MYLIVQDESILAKQGRVLVHRWQYVYNMKQWRIPWLNLPLPPPLCNQFRVEYYDYLGANKSDPYDSFFINHDRQIFTAYDTAALFGGSAAASDNAANAYSGLSVFESEKPQEKNWLIFL